VPNNRAWVRRTVQRGPSGAQPRSALVAPVRRACPSGTAMAMAVVRQAGAVRRDAATQLQAEVRSII
jgi:hypothetical protein